MKPLHFFLLALAAAFSARAADAPAYPSSQDVTWPSLGTNENDSMPLGNGDLAANVWTEQNGDVLILLAKADAWSEQGALVKPGRIRLHIEPNPFAEAGQFTQTLHLENGSIQLHGGQNSMRLWVDANRPVMHVEAHLDQPSTIQAKLELWRKPHPLRTGNGAASAEFKGDIILPADANGLCWCHYDDTSAYPEILRQEHLEALIGKYPDPFLHRCFGAEISGAGLAAADDQNLKSVVPQKDFAVAIVALTETNVDSIAGWRQHLDAAARTAAAMAAERDWTAHAQWWARFWERSQITVGGGSDAEKVTQSYAMQRYMLACSSRGEMPVKFNGGLFSVGHDRPDGAKESNTNHSPDYRAWGECYWNQNNRLLYWPLLATGDYDLLQTWFNMYINALPLAKDRTQIYYHHDGASLPETMYFFGLPRLSDFGKNNPSNEIQSEWQRYHIQGTLEVIAQMLDYCDNTGDAEFAKTKLVPFADAIFTFYDQHYQRDENGKIRLAPAQSLETYQLVAVNPTPDIAGLRADIPRLLALPENLTTAAQRAAWKKTLTDLPPIPLGRTTAAGKIPPLGQGDPNGLPTILPAEKYGGTRNSENPELYVAFPYRLYGVGKPGLQLARTAYAARRAPQKTCWGQDGTQSSVLGLTDEARKTVVSEFTNYGDERFPWFWRPGHDWIPDLDNGGSGMITLQQMLMQCDGRRIILLPAWPSDWTAHFKLHAPFATTVEAQVENGKIKQLHVTPAAREKDVEVWHEADGPGH